MSKTKDNIKNGLPKGWKQLFIKDVADKIITGTTPPSQQNKYYIGGTINWFAPSDFQGQRYLECSNRRITTIAVEEGKAKVYPEDSLLLVAIGATIGKVGVIREKASSNQQITCIRFNKLIDVNFAYYWLYSQKALILERASAATLPIINQTGIRELPIVVPTLEEQQQIVQQLDALFARIDKAIQLVEENLEHLKHLLPAAMNEVFEGAIEKGWKEYTLEQLISDDIITSHLDGNHGSFYPRNEEFVSNGVPYVSANSLINGRVDFSRCKFLTEERANQLKKGVAMNRDVLFAHNATVGPVAVLETGEPKVILSTSLTYYRCNPAYLHNRYLYFYMKSEKFINQYRSVMAQATRNQVPITKQRVFTHIIPPLDKQKSIAGFLEALETKVEILTSINNKRLHQLKALKASLLDAAFRGELTQTKTLEALGV